MGFGSGTSGDGSLGFAGSLSGECMELVKRSVERLERDVHAGDQSGLDLRVELESLILAQNERWRQA